MPRYKVVVECRGPSGTDIHCYTTEGKTDVPYFQLHRYASKNRLHDHLFFWHISELKFYDKPVKLKDFWAIQPCTHRGDCCTCRRWDAEKLICRGEAFGIERPPQSWYYVEDGR